MRKTLALLSLSLGIALVNPLWSAVAQVPNLLPLPLPTTPDLPPIPIPIAPEIAPPLKPITIGSDCTLRPTCLGWDEQIWGQRGKIGDRKALLASIDNSLLYLTKGDAIAAYQNYPIKEITLDRVRRSLLRFRQLVVSSKSAAQLQAAVSREFVFYQSVGNDGKGTVKFTAYYEPVYTASRVRTAIYKYPLYRLPPDFSQWPKPHPKRIDLEGKDGLKGNKSKLRGLELLWFRDRLDAYMVHIQGSAQIKLTNGKTTSIGYAGGTDYPWTSIGKELAKDGKLPLEGLTMPRLIAYFRQKPQELNNYLPRWERFIFFQETSGRGATGSIHVPVTAERSIATDKSLMPPGALALIYNSFPYPASGGKLQRRTVSRFVLDQDTGSAIKGPGRVDYFMGSGKLAGDRAGVTGGNGSLYYLLLKE
ncbi:MAG: murein transglycosylase A [Nostoc sp. DedQUE08]|uniref:murein transglycosylase A n=1 Tax=unclassified Nostoc TaxID=2593658 RepID=UPI002AD5AE44|nr:MULTISPECIES: murein transglycosylase A [unclassified Nostoc]MDZ8067928.1 murein transglycosylase A [Nostoc sp. DedQUE08]MDZ8095632.1 murein transglycosylase A [Nostoc sp. DedQUE05]MDZ8132518.1 murein transglycosylase A [Nostoc sp. DedQUE07]MDZ8139735.1 murein transglycosylase A [Nostoc sp. DedQUE04]